MRRNSSCACCRSALGIWAASTLSTPATAATVSVAAAPKYRDKSSSRKVRIVCVRAGSDHAAPAPSSVMNSRRFTVRCLPCFPQKGYTPQLRQESAALQDFEVYVGSWSDWVIERSRVKSDKPLATDVRSHFVQSSSNPL